MHYKLLTLILTIVFSLQLIAAPIAHGKSLETVMTKYDYLLTSHPQAHEEDFKEKVLSEFKLELQEIISNSTAEELNINLDLILSKLPTQDMRGSYRKLLDNMTQQEMSEFLSNPEMLENSIRGESANFFLEDEASIGGALVIVGIVAVILTIFAIKNGRYEFFTKSGLYVCSRLSTAEKDALQESAKNACLSGATYPENCKLDYVSTVTESSFNQYGVEEQYTFCEARYKARKKLD